MDARRRPVLSTPEATADRGTNGTVDAAGNDLSHTIRGEVVLERSRDASQLRAGAASPAAGPVSPRRARRHPAKPDKPRWATVLNVLTKNILLLVALLWVGQLVWKWTDGVGPTGGSYPFAALDYEERISEVDASLKKAVEMLQVQLEVLDRKVGNEAGVYKKELQQVEERGAILGEVLKRLREHTYLLEQSVGELKDKGFVSKAEFETLWDDFKNNGGLDSKGKEVDLDRIRDLAREVVLEEIGKHAADGLGRVDYALSYGGARVVRHSDPYISGKAHAWFSAVKSRDGVHGNAHKMLEPSFGEPGQCFPLRGSAGFVEIKLRAGIIPQAITLEHVAKSVAYDRSSAPKDCQVSAWFESPDEDSTTKAEKKMFLLTEFSYDLENNNVQTFNIEAEDQRVVNMVRLDFTSNHGSSTLTCLYRLRVHGYEPISATTMPALHA